MERRDGMAIEESLFFDGKPEELDGELLGWLREAWAFAEAKRCGV